VVEHLPSQSKALSSNPSTGGTKTINIESQAYHMPIIPAIKKAKAKGSLEPRNSGPTWATQEYRKTPSLLLTLFLCG
jgi:hypothetical protein